MYIPVQFLLLFFFVRLTRMVTNEFQLYDLVLSRLWMIRYAGMQFMMNQILFDEWLLLYLGSSKLDI